MTSLLTDAADALEHAADHAERQCLCEYEHAPECPVAAWRALVRELRAEVAAPDEPVSERQLSWLLLLATLTDVEQTQLVVAASELVRKRQALAQWERTRAQREQAEAA